MLAIASFISAANELNGTWENALKPNIIYPLN